MKSWLRALVIGLSCLVISLPVLATETREGERGSQTKNKSEKVTAQKGSGKQNQAKKTKKGSKKRKSSTKKKSGNSGSKSAKKTTSKPTHKPAAAQGA